MYYVVYTLVWNLIAFLCHYGGSLVLLDQLQSLFLRHFYVCLSSTFESSKVA